MATDANDRDVTLSAAKLAVSVRRAAAEAGDAATLLRSEPIAIVGMACRFPGGASSPAEYWRLLAEGRSGIRELPAGRWAGMREGLARHLLMGGYLENVDRFDAEFFGIAPREAHTIDPQQRLLLEVTWEALSDAGVAPSALGGTDAGVFVAVYNSDYARMQFRDDAVILEAKDGSQAGIGAAHSVASGRLSFLLNLRGPCMTVDTACSSSLVTMHLACQSLRRRECGVALAGGVSLKLLPDEVRAFAQWGMLASDGQAKTFDARADGFVPGEGCGIVVLKRLSDAVAQGDRIHAVIRGTAMNHDGRSSVLTAPNGPAQEAVMRAALKDGQVKTGDVAFVETHGTGTSLGDPIEVEALDAVYGSAAEAGPCVLGAVKTNFGHLEAAAGVAGLIKAALVLERGVIPRNLNFEQLNPQIRLGAQSRVELATQAREWPRANGRLRFAGVSSFGLGGTNAHVILEEAPALPRMSEPAAGAEWCLPISAHTAEALLTVAQGYAALLREPGAKLGEVARSAARGRDHGVFRIAVSAATAAEAAEKIDVRLAEMDWEALGRQVESTNGHGKLAFVFSGQGSLWAGALEAMLEGFPEAAKVFEECERLTMAATGWSLRAAANDPKALEDTAKAQPLLFAIQVALVRQLESWGVAPDAVAGHSVGEVAAAVAAGVLTLEEGMRLVLKRGLHMGSAGPGRMLAAQMDVAEAEALLVEFPGVELAAVNGPCSVVFAGAAEAMERLAAALEVPGRWLDVQYAFHSAAMDGASKALEAELVAEFSGGRPERGRFALVSTVTGRSWRSGDGGAAYWGRGIRERVRFCEAVDGLIGLGCGTVVEIGPHPVLLRSVGECGQGGLRTVAAMRRGQTARATLMAAMGALYEAGWDLNWAKVYPGAPGHAELPRYPWNRVRYWLPETVSRAAAATVNGAELLSREIGSAFVDGRVFETRLDEAAMPWLGEHCWRGTAILPFAAWLEIARRAAASVAGTDVTLREFGVHQRLELGLELGGETVAVQTLAGVGRELKLAAQTEDGWKTCASGFWETVDAEQSQRLDLEAVWRKASETISPETLYAELERIGLSYGPAFRLLRSVSAGPGFALGEIAGAAMAGGLHPALLDACLQTLQAAQPVELRGVPVLPVSVRSYRVYKAADAVFALAEIRGGDDGDAEANVTVVDRSGAPVAEIRGLVVRRVEAAAVSSAPMWREAWGVVAEEVSKAASSEMAGTVLSGGLSEVTDSLLGLIARERDEPGSVRRVSVVTRGAVAVRSGDRVDPEQAALVGLARSLRVEYPEIGVQLLDLPESGANDARLVAGWIEAEGNGSREAALRDGRFFTSRLEKFEKKARTGESVLTIGTAGLLETLHEEPSVAPEPGAGEVQIAVRAHGLNFRDVLTVMGSYAGVAAPLGAECSGVVMKAGRDSGFAVGAGVVAFAPGSMRSVVNVPAAYVVAKPKGMSFAEAATIPVAFLTAHYGFSRLAGLKAGQAVLVHSAAGGLGQAAVQLVRRTGATVIATAGTAEKRELLKAQGVEHVFDSRTEMFAEDVLRVTGGRCVDVVLNALSGEKIAAGFRALARGGAFLEVGKRDIWSAEEVAAKRPDARYWAFDLGEVALRKPGLIQAMMGEIFGALAKNELVPLRLTTFAMDEVEGAFRQMAGGRHVGKLVLMREALAVSAEEWAKALHSGTVLITGGTGALGLATARWLLEQGARRIVLVSRRGGDVDALLPEADGRVVVERADVTDRKQMGAVLERARIGAPLKVVIHAAGVVEDRLLSDHTGESFARGLATKVEGARVLEELTENDALLMTVYYGSLTAVVGSAGQASYAAANAFLDGMAEERSARGLRTLSVNWGAWAEGGMVERLSEAAQARIARQGMRPMSSAAALRTMGEAVLSGRTRVAIADVDWEAYLGQFAAGSATRGFFEGFLPVAGSTAGDAPVQRVKNRDVEEIAAILSLTRAERLPRMEVFVRGAARKVLGLSAGRPMPGETPLQEMGLDSLMALELRNVMAAALGRPLSATMLFDYPTIRGLAQRLLELAEPEMPVEVKSEVAGMSTSSDLEAELAAMSDAEAEELLLAELDRKGGA